MAMLCPQCSASNDDGRAFCRMCGSPLAAAGAGPGPYPTIIQPAGSRLQGPYTQPAPPMYPPGSMAYYNQAGYPLPYADLPGGRSPGVAVLLSFFIIGAGQIYNGDIAKGLGFFLGAVLSGILCVVLVGFAILPVLWICSMIDAHYGADQANRRLQAMLPPRR